jgi:hypothetical protein
MPDKGYRIKGWYDANDVLLWTDKVFEITVDANQTILLEFEQVETIMVHGGGNAIQQGIDLARSGDTVVVYAGTYDGDINLRGKDITVVSSNPDDANIVASTIIDCTGGARGFIFNTEEDANTVLDGFTIINGGVPGENGGGLFIDANTSPTIMNIVIRDSVATGGDPNDPNDTGYGGGIYVGVNSGPTFVNVTTINCSAGEGGGAFCDFNSTPIFYNCKFLDNTADFGGGLAYDANCVSVVEGCTFAGNSAGDPNDPNSTLLAGGGGLRCDPNSIITVSDCTFTANTALMGAGLYADPNSELAVIDSVFTKNEATGYGGGLFWLGTMEIIDCNITYNTAPMGAGLFTAYSPETTIRGVDLRYNRAALPIPDPNIIDDPNDPNAVPVLIDPNIPPIIGEGGGIFCFSTLATIRDTVMLYNSADTSGGAMYIAGNRSEADITNCLITNNSAGRDGGGISANWYAQPYIANCTIVANAAGGTAGEPGKTGLGGGLYVSYHADCQVTDSIFWNNYSLMGHEMYVGTGFESDPRPGRLIVWYSDVKDGKDDVYVDDGCTLIWPAGNIDADPMFVSGIYGDYYLSHLVTGQAADSPCVRTDDPGTGVTYVADVALVGYSTRTDGAWDTGIVDMGYHRLMLEPCSFCDLDQDGKADGIVDFRDFAILAQSWLDEGCSEVDGWCGGADITFDATVDFKDMMFMASCWLVEDNVPPVPDPARWSVEPYMSGTTARMVAHEAIDMWGWPVEYYFECVRGGGHDSGWIESAEYDDTGLTPGVRYGYRVKARDTSPNLNETGWSEAAYAGEEDTTPPAGLRWVIEPNAVTHDIVVMEAIADDASGVEYLFTNVTLGYDSGWRDDPNWVDPNLDPNTVYCYTVKARDKSPARNLSVLSGQTCVRTLIPPDTTPPVPNPMTWDPNDPNLWPTEIWVGPHGSLGYGYTMTCTVAADASGGVEYWFQCYENGSVNSGWIAANTWTTPQMGISGLNYGFRVKARDIYGNETAWSEVKRPSDALP